MVIIMLTNFCKTKGSLISTCSARDVTKCKHYSPNSYNSTRCLHQSIDLGDCYNCSSRDAQNDQEEEVDEELYFEMLDSNFDMTS